MTPPKTPEQIASERSAAEARDRMLKEMQDSLKAAYEGVKLSPEKQALMNKRFKQIYDPRSADPISDTQVKSDVRDLFNSVMGQTGSKTKEIDERTTLLDRSGILVEKAFTNRGDIVNEVDTLLLGIERLSPEFAVVRDVKKLDIMSDIQANTATILNAEYTATTEKNADDLKKEALAGSIEQTLLKTIGNSPVTLKETAVNMAKKIVDEDTAMSKTIKQFIADNNILETLSSKANQKAATDKAELALTANSGVAVAKTVEALALSDPTANVTIKTKIEMEIAAVDTSALNNDATRAAAVTDLAGKIVAIANDTAADPLVATLPQNFPTTAQEIAKNAIDTKIATEAKKAEELKAIEDSKEATRKDLLKNVRENVWPEMLRQPVSNSDKTKLVNSTFADSVRGDGTLSDDQIKRIDDAAHKVTTFKGREGDFNPDNEKSVTDHNDILKSIRSAAGVESSMFGDIQIGTGTAIGGGIGATAALLVGDTKSTWGMAKGALAMLAGAGLGAAYENGVFDSMLKPTGTPEGDKGKRQVT